MQTTGRQHLPEGSLGGLHVPRVWLLLGKELFQTLGRQHGPEYSSRNIQLPAKIQIPREGVNLGHGEHVLPTISRCTYFPGVQRSLEE